MNNNPKIELLSTILISIAVVCSAWCAFQASIWNGLQAFRLSDANNMRRKVQIAQLDYNQQLTLDVAIFIHYLNAKFNQQEDAAEFYQKRFRDEFRPAFETWMKQDPFHNPEAPLGPFRLPEYVDQYQKPIQETELKAQNLMERAHEANTVSDSYILLTVFFALVLFFGAISARTKGKFTGSIFLGMALVIFVVSLFLLSRYPVSLKSGAFILERLT
ncbi:MAG: hypothetical protein R3257_00555 [bacterium]|nr:hypothetical protein [bacterium]